MKTTSDVTILGTVVYGVSISTTTFTLRSRTSLGSTQMNNQSKASKSDRYWVMTSEKRSPTYVVYHFDTQRLSPTRVCKNKKSTTRDRSDAIRHHERTLSCISLPSAVNTKNMFSYLSMVGVERRVFV